MSEQLDLTIVYEPRRGGWVIASIPEVAGVFSQVEHGRRTNQCHRRAPAHAYPEPDDADDRREREALCLTIAA
jgi:hypothetical protein